ncbi:MAG: hypothetical protein ABIR57_07810, partial [Aeromicrobium sp.]
MTSHSHFHENLDDGPPRKSLARVLALIVGLIAVAVAVGIAVLWPDSSNVSKDQNPYSGQGVHIVTATVKSVTPYDCGSGGEGPDGLPMVKGDCGKVVALTKTET